MYGRFILGMVMISDAARLVVSRISDTHTAISERLRAVDPLWLVVGAVGGTVVYLKISRLYQRSEEPLTKRVLAYAFSQFRRLPMVKAKIDQQLAGAKKEILEAIHKDDTDRVFLCDIPEEGLAMDSVLGLADKYDAYGKFAIAEGRVSGAVYTDRSPEHITLLTKVYSKYAYSNPLHPDVFPGARKMEAETIRMVLNLYNAPTESSGSLTTGGTESIIMACLAYRNRAVQMGIEAPVIVCAETAHAAFDKAAFLCGMRIRHVAVDKNNRVNLRLMEKAIDSEVCMLVASAPNFPSGTVDPIPEVAKIGKKYGIPVHVDACLGGFLIPFMHDCGYSIPIFDFRNEGVTSISCDTHKYGCTPKGSSIVMYRSKELLHYQYFSVPAWTGGIYATPTICGSRAGANSAAAWATLLSFGKKEYRKRCRAIVSYAKKLAAGVEKIEGLELHGSPDVSVVAFKSPVFNIYAVSDKMNKRGWNLNTLQNPDAIHICLTYNHANQSVVDAFLRDLKEVAEEVGASNDKGSKSSTMLLRLCRKSAIRLVSRGASVKQEKPNEPRFSESAAFQGRKRGSGVGQPAYKMDYYSSDEFGNKKLMSAIGSLAVFILYFGFLREPSDLDEIWTAPPHILTANLERKMLRDQIKQAESKGQDATLLKAQLEYVDVKEAALRIQFEAKDNKK